MTGYAELRAALEAGPVGGEWGIGDSDLPVSHLSIHAVDGQKHSTIARMVKTDHRVWCAGEFVATWKYIAAANPKVIRALLAERDALAAGALKVIEMNRQEAHDRCGDADKAESWSCVRVLRAALAQGQEET